MWRSESTKTEQSKERIMDIGSIIRQNCDDKVEDGLNKLLSVENQLWYTLKAMSFYFDSCSIARPGLANLLLDHSKRVKKHYNRVSKHIEDRGLTVTFEDIPKPSVSVWGSPLTAMVTCLEMWKSVNENWHELHALTVKCEDPCTEVLVKKIICEHVKLIRRVGIHVTNLKRIGDDGTGVYLYDTYSFKGEMIPKVDTLDTDFDTILH